MLPRLIVITIVPLLLLSADGVAQALPSGVIYVPGTFPSIGDGEGIVSDTTLHILPGGSVGNSFFAGAFDGSSVNVEVNISGGTIGFGFKANAGSEVNITGGTVGGGFLASSDFLPNSGSVVNLSGGTVGPNFRAFSANVSIYGGEFFLNGTAVTNQAITLAGSDVLTGTLEDGSPFVFARIASDRLEDANLVNTSVPVLDITPVFVDSEDAPHGLRSGQTLTLREGGVLRDNFAVVNATINVTGGKAKGFEVINSGVHISGGVIRGKFDALLGSVVNISGGTLGGDGFYDFDAGSGSEVNISGGVMDSLFAASSGSVVNISGGEVNNDYGRFTAYPGSEINISGGTIGRGIEARFGSVVNISGGTMSNGFKAKSGSEVKLFGGEFLLNGVVVASSSLTLTNSDVLTGTLEDGSPFIFSPLAFDDLIGVNLVSTSMPVLNTAPITVDNVNAPTGLRAGQTLNLQEGGILGRNFAAVGATINIAGGIVEGLEVAGSVVNISGGTLRAGIAHAGSVVNLTGGAIESSFRATVGSEMNISEGTIISRLRANSGSEVNVSGGTIGSSFEADSGSVVNISGGAIGSRFRASSDSEVNISGGTFGERFQGSSGTTLSGDEFFLNRIAVSGPITLTGSDILTGTFEDGSPFIFSRVSGNTLLDFLFDVNLATTSVPALNSTPILIDSASSPNGLRAGQTLVLREGGVLKDNFAAVDATLNIAGGITKGLEFIDSEVNISGGVVGDSIDAYSGSVVNISGGGVDEIFLAHPGSVVNISGGVMQDDFRAFTGSEVNLFGTEFYLDGDSLDTLTLGDAFTIEDRNVVLSGVFADGSAFSFLLNTNMHSQFVTDLFPAGVPLTVTLTSGGDFDADVDVDGHDFLSWQRGQSDNPLSASDLAGWEANYGISNPASSSSTSVPEPTGLLLGATVALLGIIYKRN